MPSKMPMVTLRTSQEIIEKLKKISQYENRSSNKELEYILIKYISDYEEKHGEIQ